MDKMKLIWLFLLLCINCKTKSNILNVENKTAFLINKNYIFCQCMNKVHNYTIIDSSSYLRKDGSTEVYFINDEFNVDIEKSKVFVEKYLDMVKENYRSYNDHNLGIAKCLDLYNSKELIDYLTISKQ